MKDDYFCFSVEKTKLGVPLRHIDRVIRAVAVDTLPNPPRAVHGLIDFFGRLVPVINMRHQLNLPEMSIIPDQFFLLVDTSARKLAFVVDSADGVKTISSDDLISAQSLDRGIEAVGVCKSNDGIILIYDIEMFLTGEDKIQVEKYLGQNQ